MSSIDDEPSYRGLSRQHAFHQVMEVKEQLLRQAQLKGKSEQDAERIYREKIRAEWERHYVEKLTELLRAKSLNSRKGLL